MLFLINLRIAWVAWVRVHETKKCDIDNQQERKFWARKHQMLLTIYLLFIPIVFSKKVCGWSNSNQASTSFNSPSDAHAMNNSVLHCEECGACSNPYDISIYGRTKSTLTHISTGCAIRSILSPSLANRCMLKKVGFSRNCNSCWIENIVCDRKNCLLKCMAEKSLALFGLKGRENENGLTPCLQCDEDLCGPAFKACAGANRRRCGIKSDIDRPFEELCSILD